MSQTVTMEEVSKVSDEARLGRNVIALGWVAFFGGLAQDMIQPICQPF